MAGIYTTPIASENSDANPLSELVTSGQPEQFSRLTQAGVTFDVFPNEGFREEKTSPLLPPEKVLTPIKVDSNYLKGLLTDKKNVTKIRPVLLAFTGLPQSGKTKAVNHLLKYYVDANPLLQQTMTPKKYLSFTAAGISYFELVACGFQLLRNLSVTEVTRESSCAFSIISAFSKLIVQGHLPLFVDTVNSLPVFDDPQLDDSLHRIFCSLQSKYTPKAPDVKPEEEEYAKRLTKMLPEGIALINIWDLAINKMVLHFLSGLIDHLSNSHMWLFLDIQRDLKHLDQPPEIRSEDSQDDSSENLPLLVNWRPRLHYLLRTSRLSQGASKRGQPCTVFATHSSSLGDEKVQMQVEKLDCNLKQAAKHIGVLSLIDQKIETVNLNGGHNVSDDNSLRLYQKFQHVICETPYVDVPIAWVFLRSVFYYSSAQIIPKRELASKAKECGIEEDSLKEFSKFYTSFGSIFDLSLVDSEYDYVIVKPIGFLRALNNILSPAGSLLEKYPTLKYGIVPEKACREVFPDRWEGYMDALVVVHLAARIDSSCIDLPNLDRSKVYYFVPLIRSGKLITNVDNTALHVITSIDKSHHFKQAFLFAQLVKILPEAKLVCSTEPNQTIIKDLSSGVLITLVYHSPTTKIHVSEPNETICSSIIQACNQIAEATKTGNSTTYNYIMLCAKSQPSSAQSIASCCRHILPMDIIKCPDCNDSITEDGRKQLEAWNKAIKQYPIPQTFKPDNKLTAQDMAQVAHVIAECEPSVIPDLAKALGVTNMTQLDGISEENQVLSILITWSKTYTHDECQEPKQELARVLLKLNFSDESKQKMLAKDLDPYAY